MLPQTLFSWRSRERWKGSKDLTFLPGFCNFIKFEVIEVFWNWRRWVIAFTVIFDFRNPFAIDEGKRETNFRCNLASKSVALKRFVRDGESFVKISIKFSRWIDESHGSSPMEGGSQESENDAPLQELRTKKRNPGSIVAFQCLRFIAGHISSWALSPLQDLRTWLFLLLGGKYRYACVRSL